MNKSENINEIAAALSALQGEIQDAHKDKTAYGYKYADLSQVLESIRPLLSKHKLSVTQLCGSADEKVSVETILMHSSGQWIGSVIEMVVEKGKGRSMAQDVGTVITYARRYALTAIVGMTQADNDAQKLPQHIPSDKITSSQAKYIMDLLDNNPERVQNMLARFSINKIEDMRMEAFNKTVDMLSKQKTKTENMVATIDAIQNVA